MVDLIRVGPVIDETHYFYSVYVVCCEMEKKNEV